MECVAHRGYWSEVVPQNTVEAIRRAYADGATSVETDFNEESDGSILCYHDPKTRDAVIKPPFRVPTLAEVLALVPADRVLQCEIKKYGPTYAEKFDAAVKAAGLSETNVIVSSFNAKALADFGTRKPAYRRLLLGSKDLDEAIAYGRKTGLFAICPGASAAKKAGWTRAEADKVRAAGFSFRLFGVNSPEMLAYAHAIGAEAFTCNYFEDAFEWAKAQRIALVPRRPQTVDLAHAFPASVRTVGVVMPASILAKKTFDAGVEGLERAGYRVKVAPRVSFKTQASAADRAKDFEEMWLDPEVDLVLCARGGKGSGDLLPLLDWEKLGTRPNQRVLGFSNITMLLNAMLAKKVGVPIYGPNMGRLVAAPVRTRDWLNRVVDGKGSEIAKRLTLTPLKEGACRGLPVGGHIPNVLGGVEMGFAPDPAGRIVFFECVGRNPESIRGFLAKLTELGYFKNVAGVVFGDLAPSDGKVRRLEKAEAAPVEAALAEIKRDFAAKMTCPVYEGFPFGHVPLFYAVDFTRPMAIDKKGSLTW